MGFVARIAVSAGILAMLALSAPAPVSFAGPAHAESAKDSDRASRGPAERHAPAAQSAEARSGKSKSGKSSKARSASKRDGKSDRKARRKSSRDTASGFARDKGRAPSPEEPKSPDVVAGPVPDPDDGGPKTPDVVAGPDPDPEDGGPKTPDVVAGPTPDPGETDPDPETPDVAETPTPAPREPDRGRTPVTAGNPVSGGSGSTPRPGRGDRGRDYVASSGPSIQSLIDMLTSSSRGDDGGKAAARAAAQPTVADAPAVDAAVEESSSAAAEPPQAAAAPRIALSSGGGGPGHRQYEITALGVTPHARQVLGALGFRILSERRSPLLGNQIVAKLRTPARMPAEAALDRVRSVLPELTVDLAHLYRPTGDRAPVRYAADMVGAPPVGACSVNARIGLIDSGVASHPSLAKATISRRNFVARNAATNVAHGTAIASILVGDLPGSGPLAPGARLYSANVFAQDGAGLRADALAIIEALDWLAAERVPVVNLSLMGPPNELLERAIAAAASRGQVLVAAAGNDGPGGAPAYPAAYPAVIAVSAVDARGRPYSRNNRGSYVYVAAPGVDIWGADARGGQAFWTGTSFAAPFVTATLARDLALGRAHDINDGRARLAASARDLGAPGRDPIYGYGLLQVGGCGTGAGVLSSKN